MSETVKAFNCMFGLEWDLNKGNWHAHYSWRIEEGDIIVIQKSFGAVSNGWSSV